MSEPAVVNPKDAGQAVTPLEYGPARLNAPAEASLKKRAISGSFWTLGGYGATQVLRLVSNLILARLLLKEAFGLMATVQVFVQGLQMFSDLGIGPSIIQDKRGDDPRFLNTAWTIQVFRGFALWAGACALAWPVAVFYHAPTLGWLLCGAGATAVVVGFESTNYYTANRNLTLGRRTLLDLMASLSGMVVMVVVAIATKSVWSLVIGSIVTSLVQTVLSHTMLPGIRNGFYFEAEARRALFHFGRWIFINTLLGFFASQVDRLIVPRLMPEGMGFLGVYYIGLTLAGIPWQVALAVTQTVLYSVLAEHARRDPAALNWQVDRARRVILPVCTLATLAVTLGAPAFFHMLYKPEFWDAGWIAQLAGIGIWFSLLRATTDRALMALGDSRSIAFSNMVRLVVTMTASICGYKFAPAGWKEAAFMLGIAAGTLSGTVVVQFALRARGIYVMKRDFLTTMLCLALGLLGAWLCHWTSRGVSDWGWRKPGAWVAVSREIGIAAVILAGVGVWAMMNLRKELSARKGDQ